MTVKIGYGAGHGLYTAGKRCAKSLDPKETREWFLNDRIARYVEEGLKDYTGYEFRRFDDRTGKRDVPLSERVRNINAWKPDIFVSNHHDAGANLTNAGGMTVYIAKVSSAKSKVYQKNIYDSIIKNGGLRGNRTTPLPTANFYMVAKTTCPAVLVEHGFMDSKIDTPIILTDKFARNVAKGHIEFLVKQFKLKKKANNTPTPPVVSPVSDIWYRVRKSWGDSKSQIGAFRELNGAIETAKKNKGYNVYDETGTLLYPKPTPKPIPKPSTPKITIDGYWGSETTKALQRVLGTPVDGVISGQYNNSITRAISSVKIGSPYTGSSVIKALQRKVGSKADGYIGADTIRKLQRYLGTPIDGKVSRPSTTVRELQRKLNTGKL